MQMITPDKYPFIIAVALIALVSLAGLIIAKRRDDNEPEENTDEATDNLHHEDNN